MQRDPHPTAKFSKEDTKSTKEEKIIKIRCFFQSDCLFFVSLVRFVVNKKALLER